jgi:GNAT superfamily N-acetyltransferase
MNCVDSAPAVVYPIQPVAVDWRREMGIIRAANEDRDLQPLQKLYAYLLKTEPSVEYVCRVIKAADIQVFETENGETAAFRVISRRNTMPSNQAFVWIAVAENHRRSGLGNALMSSVLRDAEQQGFTEFISQVDDVNTAGLMFCNRFEFHSYRHMVRMKLDWAHWNEAAMERHIYRATAIGIQFMTYAEMGNTIENQHRLYSLNQSLSASIPIDEPEDFPQFNPYVERRLSGEGFPHTGIILAVANQEWIGMTQISFDTDHAFVEMTGVLPAYRRQGIAQALKLLSLRFARQNGYMDVQTLNDLGNKPMLVVNEKAGFRKSEGFYFVRRVLATEVK